MSRIRESKREKQKADRIPMTATEVIQKRATEPRYKGKDGNLVKLIHEAVLEVKPIPKLKPRKKAKKAVKAKSAKKKKTRK